jgi:hypothetical protein
VPVDPGEVRLGAGTIAKWVVNPVLWPDPVVRRPAVRLAAAAVLVLLPGATSTSATIEFVSGDMVSGASRLAFGIMLYPCTPLAFWLDSCS